MFRKVCSKCSKIFVEQVKTLGPTVTADKNVATTDPCDGDAVTAVTVSSGKKLSKLVLGKY